MERIGKVSKGSKMDQIYIPKNRTGFGIGNHVLIKSLETQKPIVRPYFYGIKFVEPLKLEIIREIIKIVDNSLESYENIIFTGSFLDPGFQFGDLDLIIVADGKVDLNYLGIEKKIGIKTHILTLSNKTLIEGLGVDPLYQMMLNRCIAKKRFFYKKKNKINYKMLDLFLLKSKNLIDGFDVLNGNEKYDLVRNTVAIYLYLQDKRLRKELVDDEIKKTFGLKEISELKQNIVEKNGFLKRYNSLHNLVFAKILKGIENGAKQK